MKKLPIIGVIIGGIAALFAMRKKKGTGEAEQTQGTGDTPTP